MKPCTACGGPRDRGNLAECNACNNKRQRAYRAAQKARDELEAASPQWGTDAARDLAAALGYRLTP